MPLTQNKVDAKNYAIDDPPVIKEALKMVENRLLNIADECDDLIKIAIKEFLISGKKIRPKLIFLTGACFSTINSHMIEAATAAELIHTASLIHDDVIDKSEYRRNLPTINKVSGNHVAVLAGDFLFAKAFEILTKNRLYKIMEYMVTAIQDMCSGEIIQAHQLFTAKVSEENYFERINKKTASLLSACCKAGAQSADASNADIEKMGLYGTFIGCAFQVIDDLLDVIGEEKVVGKPLVHDVEQGNLTLPFIYMLQDPSLKDKYMAELKDANIKKDVKFELIRELKQSGALAKAYKKAECYVQYAKESLAGIPDSVYKKSLLDLSDRVLIRAY
ncbi:polyprenyl synthetase family protein [Caldanaerobius polysaccharolyticus]|uniref:polyprenyl synthetase family protein n=1 Tax=Caldanaerobius polysaccharolyticus TaxID=44256 RepID=UPI00068F9C62|nr:polyprenyl synthetase family protein [Caldanaerobius polysaccharolyticus]